MAADGSELKAITSNSINDESPVWSPNGEQIAFIRMFEGLKAPVNSEIFIVDRDGTHPRRVTFNDRLDFVGDWVKGGGLLSLRGHGHTQEYGNLFWLDPASGESKRITNLNTDLWQIYGPRWWEGRGILYNRTWSGAHRRAIPPDSLILHTKGRERELCECSGPAIPSPDGTGFLVGGEGSVSLRDLHGRILLNLLTKEDVHYYISDWRS
jgi:hypothetical protein